MKTRKLAAIALAILCAAPGAVEREVFPPEVLTYLEKKGAISFVGPEDEFVEFAG